jgi:hypothetical protein
MQRQKPSLLCYFGESDPLSQFLMIAQSKLWSPNFMETGFPKELHLQYSSAKELGEERRSRHCREGYENSTWQEE